MNNYAYEFEGKLYLNITNRCTHNCTFCVRNYMDELSGNNLWLQSEPNTNDMIKALKAFDLSKYPEVVFCGFGEPTENLEVLIETAKYLKTFGIKTRLNTNGQGSLTHGKDIVHQLKGLFDTISISLNASNSKKYQEICNSEFGEKSYEAMLDFTRKCVEEFPKVVMTLVDEGDKEESEKCKNICESCGASFRLRTKY